MTQGMLAVFGGPLMAIPAIRRLQECGHSVLVIDGKADAPARAVADEFLHQDFSDVDACAGRLSGVPLTGALPLSDFAIAAASQVARQRGLPGWSVSCERCVRSKVAMKDAWTRAGLRTPAWTFSTVADLLAGRLPAWDAWPCVVKPAFAGGGSRGVFVAQRWEDVAAGLKRVQNKYLDGIAVLEEFVAGSEHTLEVVVCRGEPHLLSISDKQNYSGSATVVQNLAFPGPIGHAHRAVLEPLVMAGARAIGATDGALHFEVLLRGGEPFLLEVGGRPGGGLNFHPICEISTGLDYPRILAAILTGHQPLFQRKPAACLAWHYFPVGRGMLREVQGFSNVQSQADVVDAQLYERVGAPRLQIEDDLGRPGYVLVRADTIDGARTRARQLIDSVRFLADGSDNA